MRTLAVDIPRAELEDFCRRSGVSELALFGSVLRDDFRSDSDIDALVAFSPGIPVSLLRFSAMQRELGAILGRPVDLVMKEALRQRPDDPRTRDILATAEVLYAA